MAELLELAANVDSWGALALLAVLLIVIGVPAVRAGRRGGGTQPNEPESLERRIHENILYIRTRVDDVLRRLDRNE